MNDPKPAPTEFKVSIDGNEVAVAPGSTIIQAAQKAGKYIPHFCYHEGLSIVGQCRMCFVEIEGAPKLATACSTPCADNMKVLTASEKVKQGQNATLEFTLLNHPLDCPICDRGGECKLQDYTYDYGPPLSRMHDDKLLKQKHRPISAKVVLDQERCIVCTRCTRFSAEVDGRAELVVTNRGSADVIDVFDNRPVTSGFQGNVVDLCPVGALTATDYRFAARPWELKKHPGICTGCAVGCNIEIHTKHRHPGVQRPDKVAPNPQILRLVPVENRSINDWWLCDKGRWGYHFNNDDSKRLTEPRARREREAPLGAISLREVQLLLDARNQDGATWEFWIGDAFPHEGIAWAKELASSWKARSRKVEAFNPHPLGREFLSWWESKSAHPWFAGQPDWSQIKTVVSRYDYRELETIAPLLALRLGQRVRKGTLVWQKFEGTKLPNDLGSDTALLVDPPTSSASVQALAKLPANANVLVLWRTANARGLANEGICPLEVLTDSLERPKGPVFFFNQTTQNELSAQVMSFFAKAPYLAMTDSFRSALSDRADVALPLAPLYESESTFTSLENFRQVSQGVHLNHPNVPAIHRGGPLVNPALRLL